MIFNMTDGGKRDYYSLLTITTEEESLIGGYVIVVAKGTGAEYERYTKPVTSSLSIEFRLKQLTTYKIICETLTQEITQTITIPYYADYSVELVEWNGIAYDNGDEYVDVTGGWINNNATSFTKQSNYLSVVRGSIGTTYGTARTAVEIDLTNWDYLKLDGYYDATTSSAGGSFGYGTASEMTEVQTFGKGRATHTIDIRSVTGSYYLHIGNQAGSNQTRAYKVWLEKEQI